MKPPAGEHTAGSTSVEFLESWNLAAYPRPALFPSPTEEALANKHLLWGTGAVRGADLPSYPLPELGLEIPALYTEGPCSSLSSVVSHFKLNTPCGATFPGPSCAMGSVLFLFLIFKFFPF